MPRSVLTCVPAQSVAAGCPHAAAAVVVWQWLEFNRDYTAWAVSKGAVPSLSQTKGLVKGQVVLPKALTRSRFLTPFYKEFVA